MFAAADEPGFSQDWPDDSAAWPDGVEAWPDDDREPPADERVLLALEADAGPVGPVAGRPAQEAFAAGFTHRAAARPGSPCRVTSPSGFAAGGPLDTLAPGPVLAGLAGQAWDEGLAAVSDDGLIGVLCAARRVCSWQAALELAAVAELDARRRAQFADATDPQAAGHVTEELAAALTLTGRAADLLLDLATGLARLSAVAEALATGAIDRARAAVFAGELAALSDRDAVAVATAVLPRAADLTTGQLRIALRREVLAIDPAAARRRREQATADARLETWEEASGNSALAGRELSPASVIAADRHISALAGALHSAGASGTLDQLRAAVFAALLSGQSPESLRPVPRPGSDRGSGIEWPAGPRGTVHLTLPLLTWLGLSDAPGEITGHGPADAATCRDLATGLSALTDTRWCLTITTPDGRALGHACTRAGPGPAPPHPAGPAPDQGSAGHAPPDAGPAGLSQRRGVAAWLSGLRIYWLETGVCGHQRETHAYRPAARLRHLIKTRSPSCCFPGCRQAAIRCDDDHTVPYDKGGRSCECNLAPLCRRHHRAKQADGWRLDQPEPGMLVWTLPHGRSYTTVPEPYPV